jgi:hypothetical protein
MSMSDGVKKVLLSKACDYLEKDPENNLPKLVEIAEKLDKKGGIANQLSGVKRVLDDKDGKKTVSTDQQPVDGYRPVRPETSFHESCGQLLHHREPGPLGTHGEV